MGSKNEIFYQKKSDFIKIEKIKILFPEENSSETLCKIFRKITKNFRILQRFQNP
jgi:hypothetical protein